MPRKVRECVVVVPAPHNRKQLAMLARAHPPGTTGTTVELVPLPELSSDFLLKDFRIVLEDVDGKKVSMKFQTIVGTPCIPYSIVGDYLGDRSLRQWDKSAKTRWRIPSAAKTNLRNSGLRDIAKDVWCKLTAVIISTYRIENGFWNNKHLLKWMFDIYTEEYVSDMVFELMCSMLTTVEGWGKFELGNTKIDFVFVDKELTERQQRYCTTATEQVKFLAALNLLDGQVELKI